jgi:cob(I)alamin adenosyltransferase
MRLTKIYTKVGDKGRTMLADGSKVPKSSIRIHSYGAVDELNSFLGLLKDSLAEHSNRFPAELEQISRIQNELFDVGGELSTPTSSLDVSRQQVVSMQSIERLETEMDEYNATLEPLQNFILPGGHSTNSLAHVCRTICRRAERLVVELAQEENVRDEPRIYLNRLSDWFFLLARSISKKLQIEEHLWQQKPKK